MDVRRSERGLGTRTGSPSGRPVAPSQTTTEPEQPSCLVRGQSECPVAKYLPSALTTGPRGSDHRVCRVEHELVGGPLRLGEAA